MKYYLCTILLLLVFIVGCIPKETPKEPTTEPISMPEPVTGTQEEQPTGNLREPVATQEEPKSEGSIPSDIKELLEKGKTQLKSYSYNYKKPGSDEATKIYVKGNKLKIEPPEIVNVGEGKFYNIIYLDTEAKTAEAYCLGYSRCTINLGKIKDLDYEGTYIETPLDWLEKVTQATKIDERTVEGRKSLYLETNIGKITIASYNGFLYKIEQDKNKWEFSDAAFDSVQDSDVNPT